MEFNWSACAVQQKAKLDFARKKEQELCEAASRNLLQFLDVQPRHLDHDFATFADIESSYKLSDFRQCGHFKAGQKALEKEIEFKITAKEDASLKRTAVSMTLNQTKTGFVVEIKDRPQPPDEKGQWGSM